MDQEAMEVLNGVALVTGGAVRVGREIVLALAAAGMRVIIHYHQSAVAATELAEQLNRAGDCCRILSADLQSPKEIDILIENALKCWGEIDLLVNNAAIYYRTPLAELRLSDWDEMMNINLRAPILLAKGLGLLMKERGRGAIINIADWSTTRPTPDYLSYVVSKAGLVASTKALAKTLAPAVRVNSISPGAVMLTDDISSALRERIAAHTLLGHCGEAQDIAKAVVFLATADFITGIDLVIDGGRLIYST